MQTNHEGEFVEHLHKLEGLTDGIVLNPGAWTHYAWPIHDALELAGLPAVEVPLSGLGSGAEWRTPSRHPHLWVGHTARQGEARDPPPLGRAQTGLQPRPAARAGRRW